MKPQTTFWLIVIAALLLGAIFLDRRQSGEPTPQELLLSGFKPAAVNTIQLRRAGRLEIQAVRTNEQWWLKAPLEYRADSPRIEAFLEALAKLRVAGRISANELKSRPQSQAEFGFDFPQVTITLIQGDERRHILVGTNTPIGEEVYLQVVGMEGIYLVPSALFQQVPQQVNEWRDPTLLRLKELPFDRFEMLRYFELTRDPTNAHWNITKPFLARADNQKIRAFFQELGQWRISRFITDDPAQDLELYGLNTPAHEMIFARGTNEMLGLQFGRPSTNDPGQVYARLKSSGSVFLLPAEPLELFRVEHNKVRDRRLLAAPDAERLEVRSESTFAVERQTNGHWLVRGTGTFPGDDLLIQEWLAHLNTVEVAFEKDLVTDFRTRYGLVPPSLEVLLSVPKQLGGTLTNELLVHLQFGTNELDKVFVRRTDENHVYSIKQADFLQMPVVEWQLRDRRIWNFPSSNVVSVSIRQGGATRKLVRASPQEWALAPGSTGQINPFSPEDTVSQLSGLRAETWVARGQEYLGQFKFKERDLKITFEVKLGEKSEAYSLELGGHSPNQRVYAMVYLENVPWIFEMPGALYQLILRDLTVSSTGP